MIFKNRGITFKVVTLFIFISTIILTSVNSYNYYTSSKLTIELAKENSKVTGNFIANSIGLKISSLEKVVQNIALSIEKTELNSEKITELTEAIIIKNQTIFGTAIAFEPYGMLHDSLFYAPYSYRGKDGIKTEMLGGTNYRYFHLDWYQLPKLTEKPLWTEPYYDTGGGNVLMTTYAVPFYRNVNGERKFSGVVTADISLEWIQDSFVDLKLYDTGYAMLLSKNGSFIYHPINELVMNETIFSLAESLNDTELWDVGKALVRDREKRFIVRPNHRGNNESFYYFTPIPAGDWSLVFLFPKEEVLKEVNALFRETLFMDLFGWLVLVLAITFLARRFTKPLIALSQSAGEIAKGNLQSSIPKMNSEDELGKLSKSFHHMQSSLKSHIKELTETTTQKERIESELRIARDIQMSILPKLFPAFPEKEEFDIFASIEPAREIGGDLYDFFFIEENKFCFLIGDVSGKGVPAAFFMAVTKTLLKVISEQTPDPASILRKVNNDLAADNDSCMFVTLFIGILDTQTGLVQIGNAGHNPPVFISKGNITYLPSANEPLAGAMEDMEYTTTELQLKRGDTLFLYTDGVTEAMNIKDELYSDDKLIDELIKYEEENTVYSTKDLIHCIEGSVKKFADGAEQSDDITMLSLRYNGPKK